MAAISLAAVVLAPGRIRAAGPLKVRPLRHGSIRGASAREKNSGNSCGSSDKHYMDVSAIALSGMTRAQDRLDSTARRLASDPVDTLDLSAEMLALIEARNQFAANAQVAETGDRMERAALNIMA